MTKQEIIDQHTRDVEFLRHERSTGEAPDRLRYLERRVSLLGQIHNPRISRKAKEALGLQ